MSGGVQVTFYGVRGSTPVRRPAAGPLRRQHLLRRGRGRRARHPIVLRPRHRAPQLRRRSSSPRTATIGLHGTVLLSHLHWDHVAGSAVLRAAASARDDASTCTGPRQDEGPLGEVFAGMMRPPYFPITPDQLEGAVRFHDVGDDDFPIGIGAKVRSRWVRHVGPTLGYRRRVAGRLDRVPLRPRAGLRRSGELDRRATTSSPTRSSSSATASTC